jgi:hypothetical protein
MDFTYKPVLVLFNNYYKLHSILTRFAVMKVNSNEVIIE